MVRVGGRQQMRQERRQPWRQEGRQPLRQVERGVTGGGGARGPVTCGPWSSCVGGIRLQVCMQGGVSWNVEEACGSPEPPPSEPPPSEPPPSEPVDGAWSGWRDSGSPGAQPDGTCRQSQYRTRTLADGSEERQQRSVVVPCPGGAVTSPTAGAWSGWRDSGSPGAQPDGTCRQSQYRTRTLANGSEERQQRSVTVPCPGGSPEPPPSEPPPSERPPSEPVAGAWSGWRDSGSPGAQPDGTCRQSQYRTRTLANGSEERQQRSVVVPCPGGAVTSPTAGAVDGAWSGWRDSGSPGAQPDGTCRQSQYRTRTLANGSEERQQRSVTVPCPGGYVKRYDRKASEVEAEKRRIEERVLRHDPGVRKVVEYNEETGGYDTYYTVLPREDVPRGLTMWERMTGAFKGAALNWHRSVDAQERGTRAMVGGAWRWSGEYAAEHKPVKFVVGAGGLEGGFYPVYGVDGELLVETRDGITKGEVVAMGLLPFEIGGGAGAVWVVKSIAKVAGRAGGRGASMLTVLPSGYDGKVVQIGRNSAGVKVYGPDSLTAAQRKVVVDRTVPSGGAPLAPAPPDAPPVPDPFRRAFPDDPDLDPTLPIKPNEPMTVPPGRGKPTPGDPDFVPERQRPYKPGEDPQGPGFEPAPESPTHAPRWNPNTKRWERPDGTPYFAPKESPTPKKGPGTSTEPGVRPGSLTATGPAVYAGPTGAALWESEFDTEPSTDGPVGTDTAVGVGVEGNGDDEGFQFGEDWSSGEQAEPLEVVAAPPPPPLPPPPPPPPPPPLTPCPPGMVRLADGSCGRPVPPPATPCPPGMVRLADGSCGRRVRPPAMPCPPGMVRLADGSCGRPVPPPATRCPPGMVRLADGTCGRPVAPPATPCPPGMVRLADGTCGRPVAPPATPCPPGMVRLADGTCGRPVAPPATRCPPGMVRLADGTCGRRVPPPGVAPLLGSGTSKKLGPRKRRPDLVAAEDVTPTQRADLYPAVVSYRYRGHEHVVDLQEQRVVSSKKVPWDGARRGPRDHRVLEYGRQAARPYVHEHVHPGGDDREDSLFNVTVGPHGLAQSAGGVSDAKRAAWADKSRRVVGGQRDAPRYEAPRYGAPRYRG